MCPLNVIGVNRQDYFHRLEGEEMCEGKQEGSTSQRDSEKPVTPTKSPQQIVSTHLTLISNLDYSLKQAPT